MITIKEALMFVSIVDVLEKDFKVDMQELFEVKFGFKDKDLDEIAHKFELSDTLSREEVKEELIKILKELVDNIKER